MAALSNKRWQAPSLSGIYARESWAEIKKSWRLPQFILPSILLPVAFYGLFGIALARGGAETATYLLATYGVFAAIGTSLFGFGVGVAAEREAGLIELKRLTPMPIGAYFVAKIAAAVAVTAATLIGLYALAGWNGVEMSAGRWVGMAVLHLLSVTPFALIGLGAGLCLRSNAAVAVANLLFLIFAVLGGLWFPIDALPVWIGRAAWALPSYHLGELGLMIAAVERPYSPAVHIAVLSVITCVAGLFARWAWQRSSA
jgi:ABC-2 type transport system permease protein